jgi:hypothetical protein
LIQKVPKKYRLVLYQKQEMPPALSGNMQTIGVLVLLAAAVVGLTYLDPNLFKRSYYMFSNNEGFQATLSAGAHTSTNAGGNAMPGPVRQAVVQNATEAVPTPSVGPADFGNAEQPAGCYPRDQLTPSELLPTDSNSLWAQQNPMGTGSLKGKNFLSAGALIGVNTVGQSLRNANYQLRSEPPNPQVPVTVFNVPTIEPDVNRRALEIA